MSHEELMATRASKALNKKRPHGHSKSRLQPTAHEQGTVARESAVGDPQQPTFYQELKLETVVHLAEQYRLSITIKPDGSIVGLPSDLEKLRLLLQPWSKTKNKVQSSKKRRTRERFRRSL
jgi:hypothetical protein